MGELVSLLFFLGLCLGVPVLLVVALIKLINQSRAPRANPAVLLDEFTRLVGRWERDGQLDAPTAASLRALIAAERPGVAAAAVAAPLAAAPAAPSPFGTHSATPPVAATPAFGIPIVADATALATQVAPGAALAATPAASGSPIALPGAATPTAKLADSALAPVGLPPSPAAPAPAGGSPLMAALLSLGTRRTLLFLGAFLLVVSSLVLVIFNWASFPPLVQFALLAGVTGGIWGAGAWMTTKPDLAVAGHNLEAVAAVLVPVVGFALSRPGLLEQPTRPAWLLASILSLVVYIVAAIRSRRPFYSGAAALAAVSATLASSGDLDLAWQPAVVALLFPLMQLVGRWLHSRGEPDLAQGPRWVAQIGLPIALLSAGVLYRMPQADAAACAAALLVGALAYGLQTWLERDQRSLWAAASLLPIAVGLWLSSTPWNTATGYALVYATIFLGYLAAGAGLEQVTEGRQAQAGAAALAGEDAARGAAPFARPFILLAPLAGLLAFGMATAGGAVPLSYPLLIGGLVGVVLLIERGRLAWVGAFRPGIAGLSLGLAGLMLWVWLGTLLDRAGLSVEAIGLILLPLAALAFAGSRWWPGRLAQHYDGALHVVGALVSFGSAALTVSDADFRLPAIVLLALIWCGQATIRQNPLWAAAGLGTIILSAVQILDSLNLLTANNALLLLGLVLTGAYALGGTLLRRGTLRYWTWPALGWALLLASVCIAIIGWQTLLDGALRPFDAAAMLSLAGLLGVMTWLWRQPLLGYGVVVLFAATTMLAGARGFYLPWQPAPGDLAYLACALVLGLALVGWRLRSFGRAYARPAELLAGLILPLSPLLAGGDPGHLTLTFAAMGLLYGLACWRYRATWPIAPALISIDMALLQSAGWLAPGGPPSGAAWLLAGAAAAQASGALVARLRLPSPLARRGGLHAYVAAAIGGLGALLLVGLDPIHLAGVALLGAVVVGLCATLEGRALAAGTSAALLLLSLVALQLHLDLGLAWGAAWFQLELLGMALLGWVAMRAGLTIWRLPSLAAPLAASAVAQLLLWVSAPGSAGVALTFGVASLGLLLATYAVRERSISLAYAAGAAFVGAGLCQLANWDLRDPQWYALPAGLYLLALADGLRRFQGRGRASQVVETAAVMLLLGVTFGQALLADNLLIHLFLLCGEALLLAGYGALARLRVPFVGGVAFFVLGVSWMGLNAARYTNQWVLLGGLGLAMVAAYVLLERHQERLVRAGRYWATQLRSWG